MQMDIRFELKPKQRPKLAKEIATALHFGKGRDAPHTGQLGQGNG